jgi:hypothetical protein
METTSVLPYRTDALALGAWLAARARGRSAEQLRGAVESPKSVEGTAAAAAALGFSDPVEGTLTPLGERYALADGTDRRLILREAMLAYAPYGDMLRALGERGAPGETEARWLEAWWATRGYGGSESNRREGAAAFGRLGEFAGLGEYVPGRRGRATRIRWAAGSIGRAEGRESTLRDRPPPAEPDPDPDLFTTSAADRPVASSTAAATAIVPRVPGRPGAAAEVNRIIVPLAGDATARIEVPLRLPRAEKRRLLDLLELLIAED